MGIPRILLIDDDPAVIPTQLHQTFSSDRYDIIVAPTARDGLEATRNQKPDVILLDLRLPDASGLQVFQTIRTIDARIPIIFITMSKTADSAIEAMKFGAYDYLYKPLDPAELRRVVEEAIKVARQMREPVVMAESISQSDGALFGNCPAMREVYKSIGRVANQNATVLITGESGTGKELVARAIYQYSGRSKEPFLALNCAAIPEALLESELFGHEKGAFTGADRRRIGKFEQCNGGTILLDEIGDMPLPLQAKILRLLQEQTFERLGGNEIIHTDVRILAATHRDLKALVAEGTFRADLYYRLSVFGIHLPPLRERGDDLVMLAQYYVTRFSREMGRDVRDIDPETIERLKSYNWPGNIRELQSVIRQALLHAQGPILLPIFLPPLHPPIMTQPDSRSAAPPSFDLDRILDTQLSLDTNDLYAEIHRELDRYLLTRVLEFTHGNRHQAAKLLGIARQTLRMRLREAGLQITQSVETEEEE